MFAIYSIRCAVQLQQEHHRNERYKMKQNRARENEKILKYNHRLCVVNVCVCVCTEYIFAKTLLWKCGSPFLPWLLDCKHHLYMVSVLVSYTLLNFKLMVCVSCVCGVVRYARHVGSVVYTSRDRKYKHCIFAFVHMDKTILVIDRGGGAAAAKHLKYMLIHWTILCLCFLFSHYWHVEGMCRCTYAIIHISQEWVGEPKNRCVLYLCSKWCLINHMIWLYNFLKLFLWRLIQLDLINIFCNNQQFQAPNDRHGEWKVLR